MSAPSSTRRGACGLRPLSGIAVLLVSTELEEILELSDRIIVMSRGRIIGELLRAEATSERLGLLLGGVATDVGPSQ